MIRRSRFGVPRWLFIVAFALLFAASISASVLAFSDRPPVDLPLLGNSDPLSALGDRGLQLVMGTTDCSAGQCHGRPNPAAALYVAVNGTPINPDQAISMTPGDSFEVDFHFTNMLGDPGRFQGVGTQIIVPTGPDWRVGVGTPAHPAAWAQSGAAAAFWSATWDVGASNAGGMPTRWVRAQDRAGAYHLTLGQEPLKPNWASVVLDDRGGAGDRDGMANHAGADAMISIPAATSPGDYTVTISGVGHDRQGHRAIVSLAFTVKVAAAQRGSAATQAAAPKTGAEVYERSCSGCHGRRPNVDLARRMSAKRIDELARSVADGKGQMPPQVGGKSKLSIADVARAVAYAKRQSTIITRSSSSRAPNIPHTVQGRLLCLVCHSENGILPKPGSHGMYTNEATCATCHWAPAGGAPTVPHKLDSLPDCLGCHAVGNPAGVIAMSPEHGARKNNTCATCHFTTPLEDEDALVRQLGFEPAPQPAPTPTARPFQPSVAGQPSAAESPGSPAVANSGQRTPPDITHTLENRGACLICHSRQTGIVPLPESHTGRPQTTCQGCHKPYRPGVSTALRWPTPSDQVAPAIPHMLDGRTACTSCHVGGGAKPMPAGTHAGRSELSCLGCHSPASPDAAAPAGEAAPTPGPGGQ